MVTLSDLESGRRAEANEKEFAALRGCSVFTLQKERVEGTGPPFRKTETGRIFYPRESILEYFSKGICRSTSEYDTSTYQAKLKKAWKAKSSKTCTASGGGENIVGPVVPDHA